MKRTDQGYKNLAKRQTFTHDEAQKMAAKVWDAYGATAFSAPNGNMLRELVNVAADAAIAKLGTEGTGCADHNVSTGRKRTSQAGRERMMYLPNRLRGHPTKQDLLDAANLIEELSFACKGLLKAHRITASPRPPETVMQAENQLDAIRSAVAQAESAIAKLGSE